MRLCSRAASALKSSQSSRPPLQEVALALGITPAEAEGLLTSARRRVRAADKAAH